MTTAHASGETATPRPAPKVEILGEYQVLADALLHVLPHTLEFDKNAGVHPLQHIVIEPDGTICATNGKTIAAHRWAVQPAPNVRVLLELPDGDSRTMLRRLAKKAKKESPLFGVTLAPSGQAMVLTVGRESLTIVPAYHADEYPSWRRIFARYRDSESRTRPASVIGINTRFLELFDAGCVFHLGSAIDAVIVRKMGEPNFWGAVMPFHVEAPDDPFPNWCADDDYTPAPPPESEPDNDEEKPEKPASPAGKATVSVNGGPQIDMDDEAAVIDALTPVVDRALNRAGLV